MFHVETLWVDLLRIAAQLSWAELHTQNVFIIYIESKYADISFPSAGEKGVFVRFIGPCAS